MKKILFIVGSMRKQSFNRQLSEIVKEKLNGKAEIKELAYSDLPYMNQDIEFPTPEVVARVRAEVKEADGIWIFTPEYNYSYPGVLKNLLDWLSRPYKANDFASGTAVLEKKVTISGIGGKFATAGVREKLKELLGFIKMKLPKQSLHQYPLFFNLSSKYFLPSFSIFIKFSIILGLSINSSANNNAIELTSSDNIAFFVNRTTYWTSICILVVVQK